METKNFKNNQAIVVDAVNKGYNAMRINGRGIIVMSSYYGTDCAVKGEYTIFTGKQVLEAIEHAESSDEISIHNALCLVARDEKTRGKYTVR